MQSMVVIGFITAIYFIDSLTATYIQGSRKQAGRTAGSAQLAVSSQALER
jgi:hypothetical protein